MDPNKPPPKTGVCNWCRELCNSVKFCGDCRVACYCSTECQTRHWEKFHHTICKNLSRVKDIPQLELDTLCLRIAAHLSITEAGQFIPQKLFSPIIRRERKNEHEIHIILGDEMDNVIEPRFYDLTAGTPEQSAQSWMRVFGMQISTVPSRAVALALNTALLSGQLTLSLAGRPVTGIGLYICDNKLPKWTLVSMPEDKDSSDPAQCSEEQQDQQHMLVGFRVSSLDDSVPDETYFVDFSAYSVGIFTTESYFDSEVYILQGWASELRSNHPLLYRSAKIFRDQNWLNNWSQIWPEIVNNPLPRQQNAAIQHQLLLSKVQSVESAITLHLKQQKQS